MLSYQWSFIQAWSTSSVKYSLHWLNCSYIHCTVNNSHMDMGSNIKPQLIINILQSFPNIFSILQWFVSQKHNGAVGNLNAMKCIRHRISALLIKLCWHKHAAMSNGIKRDQASNIKAYSWMFLSNGNFYLYQSQSRLKRYSYKNDCTPDFTMDE